LQLDHVDLLAFHGINTPELIEQVVRPGGCMEVVRKLQKDGRVRFVGFSTHGLCQTIVEACETGEFDYVNLHWYYVNDLNWRAVEAATKQDMGVFIISPADKGGKLYEPPAKLVELCDPLTPMGFNNLYCLDRPEVHTLSVGAARPSDFDAHVESLAFYDRRDQVLPPIEARLRAEVEKSMGHDWARNWFQGVPEFDKVPGEINILEILRLYTYAKSLDLVEWGKMRYNLLGNAGHWFPGQNASQLDERLSEIEPVLQNSPFAQQIPQLLREAHTMLVGEEKKRQSESS
jgi:predicted aldo/keto reductase-like oxidoreductase